MSQLSRTSILVAAARAFGSREPDPAVRNPDYLAEKLLRPEDLALIEQHPLGGAFGNDYAVGIDSLGVLGLVWMMLIRTRFIDQAVLRAVDNGATQIVILGAGFDTRAYRFRERLGHCKVVEADSPATQEHKRSRIAAVVSDAPPNLSYCSLDLVSDDLHRTLTTAGLSPAEKTFFVLEGVSMYLPEVAVAKLLAGIARFGSCGSGLVLDWRDSIARKMPPGAPVSMDLMAQWGEPWIFGLSPNDAESFFRECGFDSVRKFAVEDRKLIQEFALGSNGEMYGMPVFRRLHEQAAARGERREQPPPIYWLGELSHQ